MQMIPATFYVDVPAGSTEDSIRRMGLWASTTPSTYELTKGWKRMRFVVSIPIDIEDIPGANAEEVHD